MDSNYVYRICNTIANQLGGKRFFETTGTKPMFVTLIDGTPTLAIDLPKSCDYQFFMVHYNEGFDTYTMRFFKNGRAETIVNDVYCDQLQDIFESNTGISCEQCRVEWVMG